MVKKLIIKETNKQAKINVLTLEVFCSVLMVINYMIAIPASIG